MTTTEYRVAWQREGQQKVIRFFQTESGAKRCAQRQITAAEEMTWLDPRLPDIVWGPVIQVREVGAWS